MNYSIHLLFSLDNEVEITIKWLSCVIQKHNALFLQIVIISSNLIAAAMFSQINKNLCTVLFYCQTVYYFMFSTNTMKSSEEDKMCSLMTRGFSYWNILDL